MYEDEYATAGGGWCGYDAAAEFKRQGVGETGSGWRFTLSNEQYKLCPTYPSRLCVPSNVSDGDLRKITHFRSRGRIAVLSWLNAANGAAILRSSQPYVGVMRNRCTQDENFMKAAKVCVIFDARPRKAAMGNLAMGKGYEMKGYATLVFLDIDNIHCVREALNGMNTVCVTGTHSESHWLSALESTKWLSYVRVLLAGTMRIVGHVADEGESCLVHCSDGWDRTAQLCALAQLCMDPYFRTLEGFAILIEKDWLSFGHQFARRHGHGKNIRAHDDEQRSPIFMHFLDAVWQILQQYPCSFEFNERLLTFLLDESHSCRFGTFLYNCEKDRRAYKVNKSTVSIWAHILGRREAFSNAYYKKREGVLRINTSMRSMQVWPVHFRWAKSMRCHESKEDAVAAMRARIKELEQQLNIANK